MAGSPEAGSRVVSSTAVSARAAYRNASTDSMRGPNGGSAGSPAGSTAVPWRRVWMPVTVKGYSWRLARIRRTSSRATLPYPMSASFTERL